MPIILCRMHLLIHALTSTVVKIRHTICYPVPGKASQLLGLGLTAIVEFRAYVHPIDIHECDFSSMP